MNSCRYRQLPKVAIAFATSAAMLAGGIPAPAVAQMIQQSDETALSSAAVGILHDGVWGTCSWEIDDHGNLFVYPGKGESQEGKTVSPWDEYANEISAIYFVAENGQSVEFDGSVAYLFSQLYKVKSIDLSGVVTTGVTDMSYMFYGCEMLMALDLSKFDTSSVVYMNDMFRGCTMMESVDLSDWDTRKVVDMSNMFHSCAHVKMLEFGTFNTEHVTDMNGMFTNCTWLTWIDLTRFNTYNVTNMANMFRGCINLRWADLHSFNTTNATNMHAMFSGCVSLPELDLAGFNTNNVTDMGYMFRGCDSLEFVDVSNFDTPKVTIMDGMFNGAGVKELDLRYFDVSGVEDLSYMFCKCAELEKVNVSGWDTSGVKYFNSMFEGCDSLEELDLSDWSTSSCLEATDMFKGDDWLEKFTVGPELIIPTDAETFPNATATSGKWWSTKDQVWLTKDQILADRATTSDTYCSVVDEEFQIDLSEADVDLEENAYAWTGEEITPEPTVVLDGLKLRKGVDYEVAYFQNVDVGKAAIWISGIGAYKGVTTDSFTIVRASKFIDVFDTTPHVGDIDWIAVNAIASGWGVGGGEYEFRPFESVARADMAAFLFRMAKMANLVDDSWTPTISQTEAFVDVEFETPHSREIRWLASVGISKGWPVEGSDQYEFRPYAKVARQDMAAFLFRLSELAHMADASDEWTASDRSILRFTDVDPNSDTNHHREVWWLAETGVSEGWRMEDGTYQFRGLSDIARCDIAAFLHRLSQFTRS